MTRMKTIMKTIWLLSLVISLCAVSAQDDEALRSRELYTWGSPKEGIRVGLRRTSRSASGEVVVVIGLADPNIQTNFATVFFVRKRGSNYSITLRNASGMELPKTTEGKKRQAISETVQFNYRNRSDFNRVMFFGQWPNDIGLFEVAKCFKRKEAGRVELEVSVSIFKEAKDRKSLEPFSLPSVKLSIELPQAVTHSHLLIHQ